VVHCEQPPLSQPRLVATGVVSVPQRLRREPKEIDRWARLRAQSDRPVVPAVVAFTAAVGLTVVRLIGVAHGQVSRFVMAERPFANPAQVPRGLAILPNNGYDGQFYYRLALNPTNLHRTAYGITFDSAFRVQRIGYPILAWLVSLGHHPWVPASLVIVNVLAVSCVGLLGGMFAQDAKRHSMWGLLLAGYFGFAFSVARDIAEPVAAAFMLAGVLAYRRRHPLIAGLLLAYGALTRETVMMVVAAIAIVRIISVARRRARAGRDDLAWIAPTVIFGAWQVVTFSVTGSFALGADTQSNSGSPIDAAVRAVGTHISHISVHAPAIDAWVVEFAALLVIVTAAFASLRSTTVPVYERLTFVFFVVGVFLLSPAIWNGVADLRSFDDVYLFAILVLLAAPGRLRVPVLAVAPSLLVVIAHRAVSL
jgi:hypothetical protein